GAHRQARVRDLGRERLVRDPEGGRRPVEVALRNLLPADVVERAEPGARLEHARVAAELLPGERADVEARDAALVAFDDALGCEGRAPIGLGLVGVAGLDAADGMERDAPLVVPVVEEVLLRLGAERYADARPDHRFEGLGGFYDLAPEAGLPVRRGGVESGV